MLIRILKTVTLPNVGTFTPGMVANIPMAAADNWIANGEAIVHDRKALVAEVTPEPMTIPKGMFWCGKCKTLHRAGSRTGQRHLKYSE